MSSPHLPPAEDPRRHREFRPDDEWVDPRQTGEMHFLDHLEELRRLLQQVFAGVAIGALAGWWLAPRVLADLIARTVQTTVVMSPFEAFNERLKLAALIGLMIALPYVLWRIWSFVLPGLLKQERRWVVPLSLASCVLFAAGAWAAYSYVVPLVIHVLQQFLTPGMVSQIRLSLLLDFFYNMALACGVLMQLPLVTMLLTAIGLVTPMFLLKQWRAAIVVIFVVTAAITPGDVVSAQVVMGGPMALLYFLSVGLSFFVAKRKTEAEVAETAALERGDIGHD
ncbi:MAG: twin-arginine translocase subunit TatC [Candidatus Eisenbacteria bacterium]|uniref:Sec-independent protein translocase protein TatC n=1 Tax=Eiseniibacteriota bacterium TaxID=2212470 RepID=A0A933WAV1_UNCEI|nr:twin-arginine translocase subunit TatC [Candidatus Eisenbacteria bacterium]